MDWQSALVIAGIFTAIALTLLRTTPRRRRWVLLLVPAPTCFLIYRWTAFREAWTELVAALLLAVLVTGVWWLAYGRRLPPPSDGKIRVWTRDDPF